MGWGRLSSGCVWPSGSWYSEDSSIFEMIRMMSESEDEFQRESNWWECDSDHDNQTWTYQGGATTSTPLSWQNDRRSWNHLLVIQFSFSLDGQRMHKWWLWQRLTEIWGFIFYQGIPDKARVRPRARRDSGWERLKRHHALATPSPAAPPVHPHTHSQHVSLPLLFLAVLHVRPGIVGNLHTGYKKSLKCSCLGCLRG